MSKIWNQLNLGFSSRKEYFFRRKYYILQYQVCYLTSINLPQNQSTLTDFFGEVKLFPKQCTCAERKLAKILLVYFDLALQLIARAPRWSPGGAVFWLEGVRSSKLTVTEISKFCPKIIRLFFKVKKCNMVTSANKSNIFCWKR